MYKVIYRAYRPEIFEDVLGQQHIIRVLKNQIENDAVNHAYLFCGTRGTGKTTAARLLAKGLNCTSEINRPCGVCENCMAIKDGNFMDLIEIDAASNNGVDNIRELRESVKYPPAVGRTKVYIIDEVHMLSNSAFNALLKTLEEPPEKVVFILATTEPNKLPQTVLSRCMRMDFRRVGSELLIPRMKEICAEMGVSITEDAVRLIATNADGSVRDGLTLLDQCISGREGEINREQVLESLGAIGEDTYIELTDMVLKKNPSDGILLLDKIFAGGKDTRQVMMGWLMHYRNLLMVKFVKKPEDMLNMSMENVENIRRQSEIMDLAEINDGIIEISKTIAEAKNSTKPRILLELCLVKMASTLMQGAATVQRPLETKVKLSPQIRETPVVESVVGGDNAKAESGLNLEQVWSRLLEEATAIKPQLYVLRTNLIPIKMSDNEIYVKATNATAEGMVKSEKEILSSIIEKITGHKRYIEVLSLGIEDKMSDVSVGETAQAASNILGIEVKVK
ncbi:MAG: DNA polymerase III subunit gamma/tau [Anaerovoracaceae bacterium]